MTQDDLLYRFRLRTCHGGGVGQLAGRLPGHSEFRSATFQATIAKLGARHSFIRAGRPQTNGYVERVQQTILEECWKPALRAT